MAARPNARDVVRRCTSPLSSEKRWPDDRTGEVHDDGEIIGGTLWDLRKGMIAALGMGPGVAKTDDLYYAIIQRASDIPSSYVEAVAADDNDGNLANGTPNLCVIQNAFAAHGLASGDGAVSIGVGRPTRDAFTITVPIEEPAGDCPVADVQSATVHWQVRGNAGSGGDVSLTESAASWSGAIPAQAAGQVVQYKVTVALSDGTNIVYPDNPADDMYEFWVGPIEEIYCTDFETDPSGWTHGATAGSDDWAFGTPTGSGDDPTEAASGTRVFGTDLSGGDGQYEPSSDTWAKTPEIDVGQYEMVRIQYKRWLGVEDGFFDDASITVDGTPLWTNKDSMNGNNSSTHHKDKEWRFHDLDITSQAADGKVQVTFGLKSDQGLELGGWNLDDFCIVGWSANLAQCGDGVVGNGEQCDDGNTTDGDGCSATCVDEDGPGPDDPPGGDPEGGCCSTSKDDPAGFFLLVSLCALVLARRRRAHQ
jgi:MYXO-CTERM domain-containing protein